MYYFYNVSGLGEEKSLVYSNMYVNYLQLGCKYKCQSLVNSYCPCFLKEDFEIPEYFKDIYNEL